MAKILVVGGAGYVGSAATAWLEDHGHVTWVLDDFSTGHHELLLNSRCFEARAGEGERVTAFLKRERFDAVMHFAARSIVSESVAKPQEYFENNVIQTDLLIQSMLEAGIKRFIFSSSCAIFGDPGDQDIDEKLEKKPKNPYGETKLEVERRLEQWSKKESLNSIALRYFNASGTEPLQRVGELHNPETHLIPAILKNSMGGKPVSIYGTDYPTADGTCVRDYIHVWDLAAAHGAAVLRLISDQSTGFEAYNLGSESGYSVKQIISACEKTLGRKIQTISEPRRPADPPRLVANAALAKKVLGFAPKIELTEILSSAWQWAQKSKQNLK